MMLTRGTFALISLGLVTAAILAACSPKLKDEAIEEGKMALIVLDTGEAVTEALSKAAETFTRETKVEVDVKPVSDVSQELTRGIMAESSIGVVVLDPTQLSNYAGALHSWDKEAAAAKDVSPALLTSTTRRGKIAAVPRDVSTLALYINTSLQSAVGLSESDYPTTWEQFNQMVAKPTSGGVIGLTLDASYARVGTFLVQGGGGLTSADGTKATASSEDSVVGLTQIKTFLSSGSADWGANLSTGSAADAFGQGQAAMVIETEILTKILADTYSGISHKVVKLSADSGGKGVLQFPTFYGAVEAPEHRADVIKLVEYLTVVEWQVALVGVAGTVPVGKSVGDIRKGKHADQAVFLASVEYSQPVPSASGISDVIATFDNELSGLTGGDPATILGSTQVDLQAVLS